jgi:hypothetical protein
MATKRRAYHVTEAAASVVEAEDDGVPGRAPLPSLARRWSVSPAEPIPIGAAAATATGGGGGTVRVPVPSQPVSVSGRATSLPVAVRLPAYVPPPPLLPPTTADAAAMIDDDDENEEEADEDDQVWGPYLRADALARPLPALPVGVRAAVPVGWAALPDELQLRILRSLPLATLVTCRLVCTAWRRVADDGSLWAGVDWRAHALHLRAHDMVRMAPQLGPVLRSLHVGGCARAMTDTALRAVVAASPCLVRVDLSGCRRLPGPALAALVRHSGATLRVLAVTGIPAVNSALVAALAKHAPHLDTLDVACVRPLAPHALEAVAAYCTQLRVLRLDGTGVGDAAMAALAHAGTLNCLSLRGCAALSDSGVVAIAAHHPRLHTLVLSGCRQLTDRALHAVARGLRGLSILELTGCGAVGDGGLARVAEGCAGLRRLDVEECVHITDHALVTVAARLPRLEVHRAQADPAHVPSCSFLLPKRVPYMWPCLIVTSMSHPFFT